jgi:hypothetical protein
VGSTLRLQGALPSIQTWFGFFSASQRLNLLHPNPAIFGPKASKNARLRGNKIGNLIFSHVTELMENGGLAEEQPVTVFAILYMLRTAGHV